MDSNTSKKNYTEEDYEWVSQLLGRKPRGLYKVEKYHPEKKHPMVIKVLPYVDGAPFPTLYWLTCPILKKEISHIEKEGLIETLEKEDFSQGSENLEALRRNHENYRDQRIKLFEETFGDWSIMPEPMQKILKETGIGGIADFDHIKCFHLHYAHHLVEENRVGQLLDARYNLKRFY